MTILSIVKEADGLVKAVRLNGTEMRCFKVIDLDRLKVDTTELWVDALAEVDSISLASPGLESKFELTLNGERLRVVSFTLVYDEPRKAMLNVRFKVDEFHIVTKEKD